MLDPNEEGRKSIKWYKTDGDLFLPESYKLSKETEVNKKGLKDRIKWIFDNISVILLLPSFLGAVWQILELSSINVAYIRFFSVTQIPFDGILILFLLIVMFVMGKVITTLVKSTFKNRVKAIEDEEVASRIDKKLRYYAIKNAFGIILFISSLVYLTTELFIDLFPKAPIITTLLLGISIGSVALIFVDTITLIMVKTRNDKTRSDHTKVHIKTFLDKYKNYIYWFFLASLVFIVFITYKLLIAFSASFTLPVNLYNVKNLESVIYNDFKTKDYEIEYFNDKYIFVKLCTIKQCSHEVHKEIIIYPTEKVLFKATYGKVWAGYFTTYKPINNQDSP
ncbi:hypothetical protein [uncultured Psychrobacter sp.]|uniref:hypothetical protein n=1 Tax=uncultured Psychrobacter sp. TaxID=259303 RepID=UPI0026313824|nr:hypothetical protein [uncultured Psychrobacter sp.]